MDFLVLLLILLFVFQIKTVRSPERFNSNYMSQQAGKAWRGFFACVVVFHHLSQRTSGGTLFHYFTNVGYLAVAVFFFFSGYGLQKKYISDASYKKHFLWHRLPNILVPYFIVTLLYWGVYGLLGKEYSVSYVLTSFISSHSIVANAWYIMNLLAAYVWFYMLMYVCGKRYFLMVMGGLLFVILWIAFCLTHSLGIWWYNSTIAIFVGMVWAAYENRFLQVLKKRIPRYLCFFVAAMSFALLHFYCKEIAERIALPGSYAVLEMVAGSLFLLSLLLFSMNFMIGNRILLFLGDVSYEIYLLHGLFFLILRNDFIYIQNEVIRSCMVLVFTVASAVVLHRLSGSILRIYKKQLSRILS